MSADTPIDPYVQLSAAQRRLAQSAQSEMVFVSGQVGSGKTPLGAACVQGWLQDGVSPEEILVLLPSRTLAAPYWQVLGGDNPGQPFAEPSQGRGAASVLTLAGVAQELIREFWPQVNRQAGFAYPDRLPTFLNFEAAQYFAGRQIEPLLAEGAFSGLSANAARLAVQVLQNMNLAASAGIPVEEIGDRLTAAGGDNVSQAAGLRGLQSAIDRLRRFFLEHNLLDYSLQLEGLRGLLDVETTWQSVARRWKVVLADDLEEQPAAAADFLRAWLEQPPGLRPQAALLLYDPGGGYRWELGADPAAGLALQTLAATKAVLPVSYPHKAEAPFPALELVTLPFYPQMLDSAVEAAAALVNDRGVPAEEVAILAPGMPEALSFALGERLAGFGLAAHTLRPSLTLAGHPLTKALTTLAGLACPAWSAPALGADWAALGLAAPGLPASDLALALSASITALDPLRAGLLAGQAQLQRAGVEALPAWDELPDEVQERVTPELGERYRALRAWLVIAGKDCRSLAQFVRQANAWLSRPGYALADDESGREVAANLADSMDSFERSAGPTLARQGIPVALAYLGLLRRGLVAGQHLRSWLDPHPGAVLLAPARTFLLSGRSARCQVWLEAGSYGWAARQVGAVTNPYVLHRAWSPGRQWSDQDELRARDAWLENLAIGLALRSREQIIAVASEVNEQGQPERGPLLRVIRRLSAEGRPG